MRYVGGDGPAVPELPQTMTVRVCDLGPGPDWVGVSVTTVTVPAFCPSCGGPRGADTIKPSRFQEDGDWYVVDGWRNPCGHLDMYAAVLREARAVTPPPPPFRSDASPVRGPYRDAVQALLEAAGSKRVHHAKQGAAVLREAGHTEAADLVDEQIKAQHGHLSAKQAAHYLAGLPFPTQQTTSREDVTA